MFIIGLELC